MNFDTPIEELDWIAPQRRRQLTRLGLETLGALLTHYPRRHEDRTKFDRFPTAESEQAVCVCGIIKSAVGRSVRNRQRMFDAVLEEENAHALSGRVVCRWFNAFWVEKALAAGQRVVVYGKPKKSGAQIVITHPEFEVVDEEAGPSIHLQRITPVHRTTEGLSTRLLRQVIWESLERLPPQSIPELLPAGFDPSISRAEALRQIHFPESWEALDRARRHLVLLEFFGLQLCVAAKRTEQNTQPGQAHCGPGTLLKRLHESLPFALTGAQTRAIAEIRMDLKAPRPMNRLLHGDVGSGKTLVALSAMLLCVEAGFQAALMAPTQILAEQHYLTFKRLLDPLGIGIALRTGSRKEDTAALPLFAAAAGRAASGPGSALVPRAGEGVSPSRTSLPNELAGGAHYSKRRLPHFEQPWAIYAATFSTHERRVLSPEARTIVLNALLHFNVQRYELLAVCVMPDHVHFLFQPGIKTQNEDGTYELWSIQEIFRSIKSFTSHAINKLEGSSGTLWQKETFDRFIRSDSDLEEKFHYILRNPWDANLVAPDEAYPWIWTPEDSVREGSSLSRDDSTSPRDEGAPRTPESAGFDLSTPQIFVGTHALLYEGAGITRLGLAVIDEQHKFGVMQRARLREHGAAPDVLVMTATPIPRTLTMTLYGDLEVSTLDELPANRGKIITGARAAAKLPEAVKFIRTHLEAGRQAYVVYALIDESEKLEAKAAAAEFEKWKPLLAPFRCELLHGRIGPEEKEAIMDRFRRNETQALIATTVIEVGIDVPNANIMLIENAERFGLAQLHQLRGRIGRGSHKSYCILLSSKTEDPESQEKLRIMSETIDGFEIAEADLRLRGAGDLLGTAQSGLPPFKLGNLLGDAALMRLAREEALRIFARDPDLSAPEHAGLGKLLAENRRLTLVQVS